MYARKPTEDSATTERECRGVVGGVDVSRRLGRGAGESREVFLLPVVAIQRRLRVAPPYHRYSFHRMLELVVDLGELWSVFSLVAQTELEEGLQRLGYFVHCVVKLQLKETTTHTVQNLPENPDQTNEMISNGRKRFYYHITAHSFVR